MLTIHIRGKTCSNFLGNSSTTSSWREDKGHFTAFFFSFLLQNVAARIQFSVKFGQRFSILFFFSVKIWSGFAAEGKCCSSSCSTYGCFWTSGNAKKTVALWFFLPSRCFLVLSLFREAATMLIISLANCFSIIFWCSDRRSNQNAKAEDSSTGAAELESTELHHGGKFERISLLSVLTFLAIPMTQVSLKTLRSCFHLQQGSCFRPQAPRWRWCHHMLSNEDVHRNPR